MKASEEAAQELPLGDERLNPKKRGRHIVVALNHMNKQKSALVDKRDKLDEEIEDLEKAIEALG